MLIFQHQNITPFLKTKPLKIVSLVPSQTELLYSLGLDAEVTGITKFCVHPTQWFKNKTRIGGTKTININKIKELQPDLIIANKEENVQEQIEALAQHFNVWVSDINNLDDALDMIEKVGQLTFKVEEARAISQQIKKSLPKFLIPFKTCCYLIWRDPYISIGGDTFISNMLQYAGYINIFKDELRYPEKTIEQIAEAEPEYIFLSSEPYPFTEKHVTELADHLKKLKKQPKIILVDGEMFSWYGSRLLYAAPYFKQLKPVYD